MVIVNDKYFCWLRHCLYPPLPEPELPPKCMRSEDDDDEDGDGDGDEDGDGDGGSTGNDKSSVVRHSSQFIIYECVDMELFLVFIMATLLRVAEMEDLEGLGA